MVIEIIKSSNCHNCSFIKQRKTNDDIYIWNITLEKVKRENNY